MTGFRSAKAPFAVLSFHVQVGRGPGYRLDISGFNTREARLEHQLKLGDGLTYTSSNHITHGMSFSARSLGSYCLRESGRTQLLKQIQGIYWPHIRVVGCPTAAMPD